MKRFNVHVTQTPLYEKVSNFQNNTLDGKKNRYLNESLNYTEGWKMLKQKHYRYLVISRQRGLAHLPVAYGTRGSKIPLRQSGRSNFCLLILRYKT